MKLYQLLFVIMFVANTTFAINFSFRFALEKKPKLKINAWVLCLLISSALWSMGQGLMSIQTDPLWIYLTRGLGIFGCFMFMIVVQKIMCEISEIQRKYQILLNSIAFFGIGIYFLCMLPGQTQFLETSVGVTFYLQKNWISMVYGAYFTLVSLIITALTIYMLLHHKKKRVRAAAKWFLLFEFIIYVGAFFDMVLPVLQIPATPGSAITQFWGIFVFWFIIHGMYHSKITVANMSEYIYDSLEVPVLVMDENFEVQIMNDASQAYFETKKEAEKALFIHNLIDKDQEIFAFEGQSTMIRAKAIAKNTNCEVALSKIKDSYEDIIGYIAIINDLTEHELIIEKLEQARLAADSANMAKSLFLANMSHEIRTPMNAILGFSDVALGEEIDPTAREYFTYIKESGGTLLGIINDVLNISKIELGQQELEEEEYDPARIFRDVELIIRMQAQKKGLDFHMDVDSNFPSMICGDKNKFRQVLINVLNNAVKYTNQGSVSLTARMLSLEDGIAQMEYRITDTGIGIKEENLATIFDKFKRVDEKLNSATEGTGLGLAITKGLIEMMGGSIRVESAYGEGSTFIINLPERVVDAGPIHLITDVVEAEKAQTKKEEEKLSLSKVKLLVVDDNQINLKVVSLMLKKLGVEFDQASSGRESIQLCKRNYYDMILMDQMMPEMDGVEAMQIIRQMGAYSNHDTTKIVALTANVVEGSREALLELGFDDFLGKPVTIEALTEFLKQYYG